MPKTPSEVRSLVSNPLPATTPSLVTGIVGDQPSRYAKTPPLWNAVYRDLEWDAVAWPFDLTTDALPGFIAAARRWPELRGFSVTVPFKIAVLDLLDELDPMARDIGAVNTIARRPDGALVGYNTDGQGAVDSLTGRLPDQPAPFLSSLTDRRVTLIGAGGAARAVAFFVAARLGDGALWIVNRTEARALELAAAIGRSFPIARAYPESELADRLAETDLIINATSKGQAGWRQTPDGAAYSLEPYNALGPAAPEHLPAGAGLDAGASRRWFLASRLDVNRNGQLALEALAHARADSSFFDLVYAPLESRLLADARLAGHPTLNGKWMNIAQAADGFARKVLATELEQRHVGIEAGYRRALEVMARVW